MVYFQGFSLLKVLREFLDHEAPPGMPFLWPSLLLQSEDFFDFSESTPFVLDKPLSRSRFLELFRGCLIQIGVEPQEATRAGFNRLRRFMPRLANCMGLEGTDLQAVGSWLEVPAGGGPNPRVKSRACWLMGRHYGGNQCQQSAIVKQALLGRFWAVFHQKIGDHDGFSAAPQGLMDLGRVHSHQQQYGRPGLWACVAAFALCPGGGHRR